MVSPITSMNISLPDPLRRFVESEVARGGYSTASEYFRELIRQAQREKAKAELESRLVEGLRSGKAVGATAEFFSKKKAELKDRVRKRK